MMIVIVVLHVFVCLFLIAVILVAGCAQSNGAKTDATEKKVTDSMEKKITVTGTKPEIKDEDLSLGSDDNKINETDLNDLSDTNSSDLDVLENASGDLS